MGYVLDDRNEVFRVYESICNKCKHFNIFEFTCLAFPEGIPNEVLAGKNDHSKPFGFQMNDIVFEPTD
ncbi:MAG: cytoplasmic protein [Bacteroidota bacterium]|nr:cytoplasmic protein [Bacteroidota bacterium]